MPEELRNSPLDQENIDQKNVDTDGQDNSSPENEQLDTNDKPVSLTQKQLDDLINKAFAKGARKAKRDASKPPASDVNEQDDAENKAADILQRANERLLAGTVKQLATEMGLNAKGVKVALKLGDFNGCIKDDDVDEDSVKDVLEEFAKEYPEFSNKQADEAPQKAWGMRQGQGSKMSGVEAAFFRNNPDLKP